MFVRILSGSQTGLIIEMGPINAEHAIQTGFAEKYESLAVAPAVAAADENPPATLAADPKAGAASDENQPAVPAADLGAATAVADENVPAVPAAEVAVADPAVDANPVADAPKAS